MMNFRTRVNLPTGMPSVSHADKLVMWGSCFAENIGSLFVENKFQVDVNPYGILYNPLSIAKAMREVMAGKRYQPEDLFLYQKRWHSYMHHGAFSADTVDDALKQINRRAAIVQEEMEHGDWLMVTFGTAYVYELKERGEVVANCHKLPAERFNRRCLSVDEIVETYIPLILDAQARNTRLKWLFTVSPIRHLHNGLHANQLSKSILLLAIEQLQQTFPESLFYFPSYEIMMDELRDYRFYADDMAHPSALAVNYIWECFAQTFFPDETRRLMTEIDAVRRDLAHKPFHAESEDYKSFLEKLVLKMEQLDKKYPFFDYQNEIEQCRIRLKK